MISYAKLEQQQLSDPSNLVLAHDIGLAHYWQAKKAGSGEQAVDHWQKVIANWAMVLENDEYWQEWCAERSQVYGKKITPEHVANAKKKLREKLIGVLAGTAQNNPTNSDSHLEASFHLEVKATRLLKQTQGLGFSSQSDVRLYCGPLLTQHIAMRPHVENFFQRQARSNHDSLQVILSPIKNNEEQSFGAVYSAEQQLRFCFSQLGLPFIYLEHNNPQRALDVLADLQCPDCEPENDGQIYPQAIVGKVPIQCKKDCTHFAQENPAYIGATDLYFRHALELSASANLFFAYQLFAAESIVPPSILKHIREALDFSQILGIHKTLKAEIADILLGWADRLEKDQHWDEAIALLEGIRDFGKGERWKGKLAGVLNLRGVRKFNEEHWEDAVTDLRRACKLNPYNPLFRQNLERALQGYASAAYKAGDSTLALELRNEALAVSEGEIAEVEAPPVTGKVPVEKKKPLTELKLKESERRNPNVFDELGLLILDVFDTSGRKILALALEETAERGEIFLKLPALVAALTRFEGGETRHLVELQGISPEQLLAQTQFISQSTSVSEPLNIVLVLSQYKIWYSVLEVLDLAWEIAQYDQGKISESHLLYGLLISRSATKVLQAAGINVDQIVEQAGWH